VSDALHQRPTIIVDIGTTRTSFIIFAGGSLVFTKSVTVGGHDFEVAIAEKLGVPLEEARGVKIEAGINKNYRDGKVFEALSPHLDTITNELDQQIMFYQNHPSKHQETLGGIDQIVLCGGDANLIGLEKYIATTIKKRTLLGDPFINFHFPEGTSPAIPKAKSLKYTTAIGLALRAIGR
jgi:type IV pilus assembly protein PilM